MTRPGSTSVRAASPDDGAAEVKELRFRLRPVPPFRLDLTVWALRRRAHNLIDCFDGETWRRVLIVDGAPAQIAVRQCASANDPEIEVRAIGPGASQRDQPRIARMVTAMLGLEIDLRRFYSLARNDPALGPMAGRLRGMKPVRFASRFEAFTNAVACQLVSLTAGMHVVNRVAQAYGISCDYDGTRAYAFPRAQDLAGAEVERLRELGLSRNKARYLINLGEIASSREAPDFSAVETLDDESAVAALCELNGVGRWTAEYVLLRGFGRYRIFPGDDVGGRNRLTEWLGLVELDYAGVKRALARWSGWGGLIYFHLLVDALAEQGLVRA